jgi:hypothetical protein
MWTADASVKPPSAAALPDRTMDSPYFVRAVTAKRMRTGALETDRLATAWPTALTHGAEASIAGGVA